MRTCACDTQQKQCLLLVLLLLPLTPGPVTTSHGVLGAYPDSIFQLHAGLCSATPLKLVLVNRSQNVYSWSLSKNAAVVPVPTRKYRLVLRTLI